MIKDNKNNEQEEKQMPLAAANYKLLAIGFAIILLGFILMAGGEAASAEGFNENIFSWRRITLAPIVIVAGFVFEIYAIMRK